MYKRQGWKGDKLTIGQLNRLQNTAIVFEGDAKSGEVKEIYRDSDKAWLDVGEEKFLWMGNDLLWVSERDGWRHIYAGARRIATGAGDVMAMDAIDPARHWVSYTASPENATQL